MLLPEPSCFAGLLLEDVGAIQQVGLRDDKELARRVRGSIPTRV